MEITLILLVFVFGSLIGSFLNVVILRLPKDETLGGRSYCVNCKHVLGFGDLFPFFSFLFLGGKCRYCKKNISPRYFIIESITGLMFVLSFIYINPQSSALILELFRLWFILSVLLCVFVIDLENFLILDNIVFPSSLVLLIFNFSIDLTTHKEIFSLQSMATSGFIAAILAPIPFFLIWYFSKGRWMGFGDVKLAIFLGLALGLPFVFVGMFLSILIGGLISLVLLIFTKSTLKTRIPFGTFLALGSAICLFYGKNILSWYLATLGF